MSLIRRRSGEADVEPEKDISKPIESSSPNSCDENPMACDSRSRSRSYSRTRSPRWAPDAPPVDSESGLETSRSPAEILRGFYGMHASDGDGARSSASQCRCDPYLESPQFDSPIGSPGVDALCEKLIEAARRAADRCLAGTPGTK